MKTAIVNRSQLELLAFTHPGAQIEITADAAFLTLGPVQFYALLGGDE